MCGIVLIDTQGNGKATKSVFRRYQAQQGRGKLGFGCVSVSHKKINKVYRSVDETGIRKILGDKSDMALFHHRHPTSTPNYEECTHPIFVSNELLEYDYYVTHNGIISNPQELKTEFEKLGFTYTTELKEMFKIGEKFYEGSVIKFNDSESFAIDICIAIEQGNKKIKSKGSVAFVALQVDKEKQTVDTIFFGRNTNPLKMQNINQTFTLASLGAGDDIEPHMLYAYDTHTKKVTTSELGIGENYKPPVSYLPPSTHHRHSGARSGWEDDDGEGYFKRSGAPYGRKNSQLIAVFPKHDNALDALMARATAKGKKKDKKEGLIKSSISIKNAKNIDTMVVFSMRGEFLDRTDVHFNSIQKIQDYQWDWYKRIVNDMDANIKFKVAAHRVGSTLLEQMYSERISARARELKLFSDIVNNKNKDVAEPKEIKAIMVM